MQDNQPWRAHGKCASLPLSQIDDLFFIGRGKSPKPAQQFCAGCPVRKPCLFYAVYYNEKGIWAGTTDEERESLKAFIYNEVVEAMSITVYEIHDVNVFIPKVESRHEGLQNEWGDDERLVG